MASGGRSGPPARLWRALACLLPGSQMPPSSLPTLGPMRVPRIQQTAHFMRLSWLVAGLVVSLGACTVPDGTPAVWVAVPSGDSITAVAESLEVHEIVESAESFERFARMGRRHLGIKAGVYPLRPGSAMGKVLAALRKGTPAVRLVQVKPGIWLSELAPVVEAALGIEPDSFMAAARDSALRADIGAGGETVEGYLYPISYYVPIGASALEVVRQMTDSFEAHWKTEWNARLDTLGVTRDEIVTLASIIEGEDPHDLDRELVASVYENRLATGLRLQADPTVVYAIGSRRRLYNKDYSTESKYNTYRVWGLPPSPISQPTEESLKAALYPAPSDFYYFVARADGRHVFSRSYREHLATIRKIRNRTRRNGPQTDQ